MQKKDNEDALEYYDKAEETREVLGITDSSVSTVYFLKNRGSCLYYLSRHQEAVKVLKEARGLVEKLPGDNIHCKFLVYSRLTEVLNKQECGCPKSKEYAKEALEVRKKLKNKFAKTILFIASICKRCMNECIIAVDLVYR